MFKTPYHLSIFNKEDQRRSITMQRRLSHLATILLIPSLGIDPAVVGSLSIHAPRLPSSAFFGFQDQALAEKPLSNQPGGDSSSAKWTLESGTGDLIHPSGWRFRRDDDLSGIGKIMEVGITDKGPRIKILKADSLFRRWIFGSSF